LRALKHSGNSKKAKNIGDPEFTKEKLLLSPQTKNPGALEKYSREQYLIKIGNLITGYWCCLWQADTASNNLISPLPDYYRVPMWG